MDTYKMINRILLYMIITRVIACNMYSVKSVGRGRVLAAKEKYVMRYFFLPILLHPPFYRCLEHIHGRCTYIQYKVDYGSTRFSP